MAGDPSSKVEKLIDAALDAFARDGLAGTRIDAIARAAGMNKRLLYHYVGDKAALFDAATQAAVARLEASDPPGADVNAWRVLCHASAAGRCPDLTALLALLGSASEAVLGRRLILGLLPELATALPEPDDPPLIPADTVQGMPEPAHRHGREVTVQSKPRIKLRPSLGPGS